MVERLISVDVERLGNVQWWSLVSKCISDQLVRTMQCEAETRGCCAVSMWDITRDQAPRGTRIARMLEHEKWDRVLSVTCIGVPLQLRPDQRSLARLVVPEAEADQGVAPVIVMPAAPKTDRRRYVTKRDLVKYGYTDECQACTQLASGMHNAKLPHDDRCRDRYGELLTEDDDQRQVERASGTVHPEVEIPRPAPGRGRRRDGRW